MEQKPDLMSIGEAARALGVSVDTIRRWESEGKITGTRTLGNQRRFSRSEVESHIERARARSA